MMKKLLSVILSVTLIVSALSALALTGFAAPAATTTLSVVGTGSGDTWVFDDSAIFYEGYSHVNYTGTLPNLTDIGETGGARYTEEGFFTYKIPINMANYKNRAKLKLKLLKGFRIEFSIDNAHYTDAVTMSQIEANTIPAGVTYDAEHFEVTLTVPEEAIKKGLLFVRFSNQANKNPVLGSIVRLATVDGPYLFSLKLIEFYDDAGIAQNYAVPSGGVSYNSGVSADSALEALYLKSITGDNGLSSGVHYCNGTAIYQFPITDTAESAQLLLNLNRNYEVWFSTENDNYEKIDDGKSALAFFENNAGGTGGSFQPGDERKRLYQLEKKYIDNGSVWVKINLAADIPNVADDTHFYISNVALFESGVPEPTVEEYIDLVPVTSVSVNPPAASLTIGETVQLAAIVAPDDASNKTVTWSSDNSAVASANGAGLVTAVSAGTAVITALSADGSKSGSCTVTVSPAGAAGLPPALSGKPELKTTLHVKGTGSGESWTFDDSAIYYEGFANQNYSGTLPELSAKGETGGARFTEEGFFTYKIPVNMANYKSGATLHLKFLKGFRVEFSTDNAHYTDMVTSEQTAAHVSQSKLLPPGVSYSQKDLEVSITVPDKAIETGHLFVRISNPKNKNTELGSMIKLGSAEGPYLFSVRLTEFYESAGIVQNYEVPAGGVNYNGGLEADAAKEAQYLKSITGDNGVSSGVRYCNETSVYQFPINSGAKSALLQMHLNRNYEVYFSADGSNYTKIDDAKSALSFYENQTGGTGGSFEAFDMVGQDFFKRSYPLDKEYIDNGFVWVKLSLAPDIAKVNDDNYFYLASVKLMESSVEGIGVRTYDGAIGNGNTGDAGHGVWLIILPIAALPVLYITKKRTQKKS